MEITQKITINITKDKDKIICKDVATLQMIMGSKGVSGNCHLYNIERVNNTFVVSLDTIKKRILTLESRKEQIESSLQIMKQLI